MLGSTHLSATHGTNMNAWQRIVASRTLCLKQLIKLLKRIRNPVFVGVVTKTVVVTHKLRARLTVSLMMTTESMNVTF